MQRLENSTVPYAPVNEMAEAVTDAQVVANGYVTPFEHPVFGNIQMLGFPTHLSETPAMIRRRAPELGEHTEEILIELLGMDWDQIGELRDGRAI